MRMKKREEVHPTPFYYNDEGAQEVSAQIMDAYNSGVIDHPEARFDRDAITEVEIN